jgi:hypothetical protein
MQRFIKFTALLFLFVVFPITSWYYLKTGAQWRRENLLDLDTLEKLPVLNYIDGANIAHNLLERKVCVIYAHMDNNYQIDTALRVCSDIYDQFNARPELRILIVSPEGSGVKSLIAGKQGGITEYWLHSTDTATWHPLLTKSMQAYTKKRNWEEIQHYVALSDINGNIKSVYNLEDKNSLSKLAQQLAILLPLK